MESRNFHNIHSSCWLVDWFFFTCSFITFQLPNNFPYIIYRNSKLNTVIFSFEVFYTGVAFMLFYNIPKPIKTLGWGQETVIAMIQTNFFFNRPKNLLKYSNFVSMFTYLPLFITSNKKGFLVLLSLFFRLDFFHNSLT